MITNPGARVTQTYQCPSARRDPLPGGSSQGRAVPAPPYPADASAARPARTTEVYLRSLDEAELVRRATCAPGGVDSAALGVLYERHAPSVFAFALSRLRNAAQAEDITAQTFLQVLRALPRYRSRGVPIRSWFLTIAANLIRDAYRRARTQPGSLGDRDHAMASHGMAHRSPTPTTGVPRRRSPPARTARPWTGCSAPCRPRSATCSTTASWRS